MKIRSVFLAITSENDKFQKRPDTVVEFKEANENEKCVFEFTEF